MIVENENGQKVKIIIDDQEQKTVVEQRLIGNHLINIVYDSWPESPRDWDNLGSMAFYPHQRYNFGGKKILDTELKTYNQYLNGDVYGYQISEIETFKCKDRLVLIGIAGDIIDSCYGYFGIEDAINSALECILKKQELTLNL